MPRLAWRCLTLGLFVAPAPSCRSQKVPEPSPVTPESTAASSSAPPTPPSQAPRFAWTAPLSIPVEESLEKSGQKHQLQFHLDVCPGTDGTLLLTHRDMHLLMVNGVPAASALSASERRQIEVATSTLPTMVIDRAGTFVRATGLTEMVDRLALLFPGEDFSHLRRDLATGTTTRTVLEGELATRWLDWVGL